MRETRSALMQPLFVVSDLQMGGAQRVVLTVVRHLARSGFEPALALISDRGPLSGDLPQNIPIHNLGAGRVRYALLKLLQLCRALQPDAVISTVGHLNLLLLSLKPFLPRQTAVIVREANTPSIRLQHTSHPRLYRAAYRRLYPVCDRLICNCSYMKEDMTSRFGFPSRKVSIIPNPVDMERVSRELASGENPYHGEGVQIAAVGRLEYQKGFDLLLKAFRKSRESVRSLRLTIVGDGPKRGELERHAAELAISDTVEFPGQKENPFPYMAHADFVVSSSRWEGSPNTVLESLACGTPVLAFDCPGGTAEIIQDRKNGWLIPAGNWETMGERMAQVAMNRSWQPMNKSSLLPEQHRCENVVARWEEVLRKTKRNNGMLE